MAKFKKIKPAYIALTLLCIASCTTQKNTWVTRTFHNTCTHYNGYFWGKLAYDEGLDNLNQTHKDDYSDIIPVYVYPDQSDDAALYPNMSRAIKKADTMIQKHTITTKAKREIPDAVHYIKYCYLLLAQAHLYKNDLMEASDVLDYATKEYRKTDYKYEALVWQARTYNQFGSISKGDDVVELLESAILSGKVPKATAPEVYAVAADWNMRIGQYAEVDKQLHRALKVEKNKKVKARYYFIIAQIAQRDGDNKKAYDCYTQCLMLHPYNEMDFEAQIQRALLYMGGTKENERIKASLVKMLRPTKYIDDRDQIYYALAEMALKENDESLAIKDLHKSIRASTTNATQKGISFLALGNIAFDHENYKDAKYYYDSTIASLPKTYRGRDSILAKKENLDKLVRYMTVIEREDSLQKIARLGLTGAGKYVDSLIAAEQRREEEKKEQEKEEAEANQANNTAATGVSNGKWYFYNPGALSQGITEFTQQWGNRPLEDNWRRSHKIPQAALQAENETANDSTKKIVAAKKDSSEKKYDRGKYLGNIPFTDAQLKASNDSIIEAYYNIGFIYMEYIKNNRKAEEDFEEMLSRYPDNKYKLQIYYELYSMYTQTGNAERADYYKNILVSKYPDTEYALLISNPEKYRQQQEASRQEILKIYSATLRYYRENNYAEVMNSCQQVDSLYPQNPQMPKFAFMEAAAIGHAQGLEAYKNALEKLIIQYPKDTMKTVAQSILEYLNKEYGKPHSTAAIPKTDSTTVNYSKEADTSYYYILTIDNRQSGKVNAIRNALSDINTKIYSENQFNMDDIFLNPDEQILVIHKFHSAADAKDYYHYVSTNTDLMKALPPGACEEFYISDKNFHTLYKHGKSVEYVQFFNKNLK